MSIPASLTALSLAPAETRPSPIGATPTWPSFEPADEQRTDFFSGHGEHAYAGKHIILDMWGGSGLDDLALMESAFREAVELSGATLLHIHLHHFTPNDGISGVAVLAESHISVHTWPERDYAAFDIFMCGDASPERAVDVLERRFAPDRTNVRTLLRGCLTQDD